MFEAVEALVAEHAALEQQLAEPEVFTDQARARRLNQRYAELTAVVRTPAIHLTACHESARVTLTRRHVEHTGQSGGTQRRTIVFLALVGQHSVPQRTEAVVTVAQHLAPTGHMTGVIATGGNGPGDRVGNAGFLIGRGSGSSSDMTSSHHRCGENRKQDAHMESGPSEHSTPQSTGLACP